jgi:hypothetical protein
MLVHEPPHTRLLMPFAKSCGMRGLVADDELAFGRRLPAAQRRRPRMGCARKPVGTSLYLHAVGAGS